MLKRFFAQTRDFAVVIRHLRLEIGSVGLWPFAGVFAVSMFVMLFEGVGVGLLVPMLSLLLGGENATPMRPIQWLQSHFPGQSPSVYLSLVCIAIVCAIAAKNAASYTSQILASRLKRRVATNMRDVLFERLHRADLDVFDRAPGGEIANIFLVETYRSTVAIESFIGYVQRSSIALFYLFALFYISLRLTLLVVVLAVVLGFTLSFVYGRLSRAGIAVADLNHRLATTLTQSFAGVRVVRAANAQRREIDEFKRLNGLQADAEYASARAWAAAPRSSSWCACACAGTPTTTTCCTSARIPRFRGSTPPSPSRATPIATCMRSGRRETPSPCMQRASRANGSSTVGSSSG